MTVQEVVLATLVEDFGMYPRHRVDDAHVSDLVRALQAGNTLPPIIADAASLRIVDGFHRRRAYIKHQGDDAVALVELREYPDETALFLDAVAFNSAHGRKLDRQDQTRIILKLRELHVADQVISMTLHVPEPTVQQLSLRIVQAPGGPIPSKRGLEHLRGQAMTAEQVEVMKSVRSAESGRLCLELIRLLRADMVDLSDAQVIARLRELEQEIAEALRTIAA